MQTINTAGLVTHIRLTRGDSFYAVISMTRDGEAYVPAEGDTIRFAMKRSYYSPTVILEKTIPTDTMLLALYPDDTADLDFGAYVFDIELTTAGGDVDTFILGELVLEKEVK